MYVIEYRFKDLPKSSETFETLEKAYSRLEYYRSDELYTYCQLFKLVPIEVELKAVEKV